MLEVYAPSGMRTGEVKTNRWVVTRIQKIADVKYERSQNAENFIGHFREFACDHRDVREPIERLKSMMRLTFRKVVLAAIWTA